VICIFDVVLLLILTDVGQIRRMEDSITLILHHGGCLERDEYRRLQYVCGEFCVWEKMDVDQLCLWDIEKMAKRCRGYFKVFKLWYWKPYEGAEDDINICLTPLTTDKDFCDMVQVARANGNEVEIYAQDVVDIEEVEIVPLTNEEREELETAMEESLKSMTKGGLTTEDEPVNIMEVDILSAEERNVVNCLVASVQNRVYNQEENVGATQGRKWLVILKEMMKTMLVLLKRKMLVLCKEVKKLMWLTMKGETSHQKLNLKKH